MDRMVWDCECVEVRIFLRNLMRMITVWTVSWYRMNTRRWWKWQVTVCARKFWGMSIYLNVRVSIFSGTERNGRNGTTGTAGTRWPTADLKRHCRVYHIYYIRNYYANCNKFKIILRFRHMIWKLTQWLNWYFLYILNDFKSNIKWIKLVLILEM